MSTPINWLDTAGRKAHVQISGRSGVEWGLAEQVEIATWKLNPKFQQAKQECEQYFISWSAASSTLTVLFFSLSSLCNVI